MGKSTMGPELTDVAEYLKTICEHHRCQITVLITPSTGYGGLPLSVVVVAAPARPEDPWNDQGHSVERKWPNRANRTFEGCLYAACMDLDTKLSGTRWDQETFPT